MWQLCVHSCASILTQSFHNIIPLLYQGRPYTYIPVYGDFCNTVYWYEISILPSFSADACPYLLMYSALRYSWSSSPFFVLVFFFLSSTVFSLSLSLSLSLSISLSIYLSIYLSSLVPLPSPPLICNLPTLLSWPSCSPLYSHMFLP